MSSIPAGHYQTSYSGDMAIRKTVLQRGRLVALVLLLFAVPAVTSPFYLRVAIAVALAVPGAIALSLLTGVAGQISLGNAAFMGIGATGAAVLATQLGWSLLVVVPTAGLVTGLVGAIVGIPSLRVRGLYLIIATLALHFVMVFGFRVVQQQLVGEAGFILPTPTVAGFELDSGTSWYYVLVGFAALVTLAHVNLVRSRTGRAWKAIMERDIAAEILGVAVGWEKIKAFAFTSAIIGIQGALSAYYLEVVNYESYTLTLAIAYVAMVIIGGLGSHVGAIYGAAFVTSLPYLLPRVFEALPGGVSSTLSSSIFEVQAGLYGLMIIVFMMFEPRGIAEITSRIRKYFVLWPFSRERLTEQEH